MNHWKKGICFILCCLFSFGCGQANEVVEEESNIISSQGITPKVTKTPSETKITPTPTEEPLGYPINMEIEIDAEVYNGMNRKLTRDTDSGASLFCLDENETVYFVN